MKGSVAYRRQVRICVTAGCWVYFVTLTKTRPGSILGVRYQAATLMTSKALPSRLRKEPLIDAVCEIRFSSATSVSDVLPGLLMAKFPGQFGTVERLPISSLPEQVRDADPNLRYQPLLRLSWGDFYIIVGHRTLGVSCKFPYPGWTDFKKTVMSVIDGIKETGLFQKIERYSMKYIDIIESKDLREMISWANLALTVGEHRLEAENFLVRVEIPENDSLHIVQITAPVTVELVGNTVKSGLVVDIDSICLHETQDVSGFFESLPDRLDAMHMANKAMFFSCLTDRAIESLEPEYDRV